MTISLGGEKGRKGLQSLNWGQIWNAFVIFDEGSMSDFELNQCDKACEMGCWGPLLSQCYRRHVIIGADKVAVYPGAAVIETGNHEIIAGLAIWVRIIEGNMRKILKFGEAGVSLTIENGIVCLGTPNNCVIFDINPSTEWYFLSISWHFSETHICLTIYNHPKLVCNIPPQSTIHPPSKITIPDEDFIGEITDAQVICGKNVERRTLEEIFNGKRQFAESGETINLTESRELLTAGMHFAVFTYQNTASKTQNQHYTFENTHLSTAYIRLTVQNLSTSPVQATPIIEVSKPYSNSNPDWVSTVNDATTVEWRIIQITPTDSAIIAKGGTMLGQYTVGVKASKDRTAYEVKITIACSETTTACFCPSGKFPNSGTSNCSICSASDYLCPNYPALGCLPMAFAASLSSNTFNCLTCVPPTSNSVLDRTTGNCIACDTVCARCFGAGPNQCAVCYTNAVLQGTVGSSTCQCVSNAFPSPDAANCLLCASTCATCSDATANGCVTCKANAVLSAAPPGACACAVGFMGTADSCVACSPTCLSCSSTSSKGCVTCKPPAVLSGASPNSCICPTGYYANPTSASCALCHISCLTCSGPADTQCGTCKSNAKLSGGSCVCVDGYYGTPDNCLLCDATCQKCGGAGASACTGCKTNAHLVSAGVGSCVCDNGFFPNTTSANCQACDSTCLQCTGAAANQCLSCKANASLSSVPAPSSCICQPSYYPATTAASCKACDTTCVECVGGGSTQCTKCATNAELLNAVNPGTCVCSVGFFPSTTSASCAACDATCAKCSAVGPNGCTTCYSNAALSGSVSPSACVCVNGFYPNPSVIVCSPCHSTCLTCNGGASNQCVTCPYPTVLTSESKCACAGACTVGCHPTCNTCDGAGISYCLSCWSNAQRLIPGAYTSECVCSSHNYPNPDASKCALCHQTCQECLGAGITQCSACYPLANLATTVAPGACVCQAGYYPNADSATCAICDSTCQSCIGSGPGACSACYANAGIPSAASSGSCVCNLGFFPNSNSSNCSVCHSTCKSCQGPDASQCTDCFLSAQLSSAPAPSTCQCIASFYPNPDSASCQACDPTCLSCSGPLNTNCLQCYSKAELENGVSPGKCVCSAANFTLTNTSACQPCDSTCTVCSSSGSAQCQSCYPHAVLSSLPAPSSCKCDTSYAPGPTVANCILCAASCLTCAGTADSECTTCFSHASTISIPGQCLCQNGYFPAPTVTNCQPCDISCKTCIGSGTYDCTACYSNAELRGGTSPNYCDCSGLFFPFPTTNLCVSCHPTCQKCDAPGITHCLECLSNAELLYHLVPSSCTCSPGFYPSPDSSSCISCDATCILCDGAGSSHCLECFTNAALPTGLTVGTCSCGDGYFPATTSANCQPCYPACAKCSAGTAANCLECVSPTTKLNGNAVDQCVCPGGTYLTTAPVACQPCDASCKTCSLAGPSGCQTCPYPNNSILGGVSPGVCGCSPGFFPTPGIDNCQPCYPTCLSCSGSLSNQCLTCYTGAGVGGTASGECICLPGFFPSPTAKNCASCSPTCSKCVGSNLPTDCLSCQTNAILTATPGPSTCVCVVGFFPSTDASNCVKCDVTCSSCGTAGADKCTGCLAHAALPSLATVGTCSCLDGYYPNLNSASCATCYPACARCVGGTSSDCTACVAPTFKLHGSATDQCVCPTGTYFTPSPIGCSVCDASCKACSAAGVAACVSCAKTNTALVNEVSPGTCACAPGFFPDPDISNCKPCDVTCVTCASPAASSCLQCRSNASLSSGKPSLCVCSTGFFPLPDSSNCTPCPGLCATCTSSTSACGTCKDNSSLKALGGCACNAGFFLAPDGGKCLACSPTCLTCLSSKTTDCQACAANSSLAGTAPAACVCDLGYVQASPSAPCTKIVCDAGCSNCSLTGVCSGCLSNATLKDNKCVCTAPYYANPDSAHCSICASGQCGSCVPDCGVCSTNTTCKSCQSGFALTNNTCVKCGSNCVQCTSESQCTQCISGMYPALTGLCEFCANCDSPLVASAIGPIENSKYEISFSRTVTQTFKFSEFLLATKEHVDSMTWDIVPNATLTLRVTGGPWANVTSLSIEFLSNVTDIFGFYLSNNRLSVPPPIDPPVVDTYENTTVQTAATTAGAVVAGGAVLASVSVGGGSLAVALLSQMQYFSYIGTADYSMTGSMNNFYSSLNQKSSLPNVFVMDPADQGFRRLSSAKDLIEVYDFLNSSGQFITVLCAIFTIHAVVFVMSRFVCRNNGFMQKVNAGFVWGVYFYYWSFAYLDLQVSAFLQLKNNGRTWSSSRVVICNLLALFFLATTLTTPFLLYWFISKHQKALLDSGENRVKTRFSAVVASLRVDVKWAKYMYPVFYFQRLIYSLFIVFLRGRNVLQAVALIIPCALMAIFTVLARPLLLRTTRIIGIIAEIDTLVVFILLCFATLRFNTPQIDICWLIVAFTLKSFICSVLIMVIGMIAAAIEACRKKKAAYLPTKIRPILGMGTDAEIKTVDYTESDVTFADAWATSTKKVYPYYESQEGKKGDNSAHSTHRSDMSNHTGDESLPGRLTTTSSLTNH